jgi:hypothetical protein
MSIVDPTAAKSTPVPRQAASTGAPKPVPRPAATTNGVVQAPQLKRKASGGVDSSQVKLQRKDGPGQPAQANVTGRAIAPPAVARPNPPATISTVAYRGTAAPAGARGASPIVKKPNPQANTLLAASKAATPAPKPAPVPAASSPATTAAPKKGYLALLQKAKEKDATKPAAPPVQNGPAKILTKKERLALKAEASAGAKGKKSGVALPGRPTDPKADIAKEKKKPVEVGYQGTARPTKAPVQVGYKGTARPASAPASSSRGGTPATKSRPKPAKGRFDGYADWSDLDDMEGEEEEDYASDASSDMEGGVWDVEEEETLALKVAKKEDAEALAQELKHKREKEDRKRRLMAMSKAAATKKRY